MSLWSPSRTSILFSWDCTFDRRKPGKGPSLGPSQMSPLFPLSLIWFAGLQMPWGEIFSVCCNQFTFHKSFSDVNECISVTQINSQKHKKVEKWNKNLADFTGAVGPCSYMHSLYHSKYVLIQYLDSILFLIFLGQSLWSTKTDYMNTPNMGLYGK